MKNQFVTYNIALKLKELGFDEKCLAFWDEQFDSFLTELLILGGNNTCKNSDKDLIKYYNFSAPLYQQAFDFFREKHNIHISVDYCKYSIEKLNGWYYTFDFQTDAMPNRLGKYDTYEQAREQSILKAIELCQKK